MTAPIPTVIERAGASLGIRPIPALAAATALGALVVTADGDDGFVVCPFRRCTGGYCPGCGGTRAARSVVTGDVAAAWSHNPWVVLLAGQFAVLAVVLGLVGPATRRRMSAFVWVPLAVGNAALAIMFWLVRLHDGTIPSGWMLPL